MRTDNEHNCIDEKKLSADIEKFRHLIKYFFVIYPGNDVMDHVLAGFLTAWFAGIARYKAINHKNLG